MFFLRQNRKFFWVTIFSLFTLSLTISGCKTNEPQESVMPWAQPAEWEKQNMLQKMGAGF